MAPRRSGRARAQPERLGAIRGHAGRSDSEATGASSPRDSEGPESATEDDEQDDDFRGPRARVRTGTKKAPAGTKRRSSGEARKRKSRPEEADAEHGGVAKGEYEIPDDNAYFNAIQSSSGSLMSAVNDWLDAYQEDGVGDEGEGARGAALADLINAIFRSCGCSGKIDQHEVLDLDAATDALETIQEDFKRVPNKAYPLVARSKRSKRFRSSLLDFFSGLVQAAHASDVLYDSTFCAAAQTWLVAMSSSKIRAFRHTATVISLALVTELAGILDETTKALASLAQQVVKKGRQDKARTKAWEQEQARVHKKKEAIESFIADFFDGVFIHRYRDAEPPIRVDCIRALESWMRKNSAYFLEGSYLRYVGWVLTDKDAGARLEAVKALSSLYSKEDNIGGMQHFTERFKGRLVEMATAEPDATVRVESIKVLRAIDLHGLLEDEERAELTKTLFHEHGPTRSATAPFVATLLQEAYDDLRPDLQVDGASGRRGAKSTATSDTVEQAERMLHLKCLAMLIAKSARDGAGSTASTSGDDAAADLAPVLAVAGTGPGVCSSRVAAAVDALWPCHDAVKDQAGMVALLLRADEDEDALRLTKDEETTLLELLVESCRRAAAAAKTRDSDDDDSPDAPEAAMTRLLITELPRLLAKYLRDTARLALLLRLPTMMELEEYVSSRKVTAFEALWDDLSKIFVQNPERIVQDAVIAASRSLGKESSLKAVNEAKLGALEASLFSALDELIGDRDVETASFDDDEVVEIEVALARIGRFSTLRCVCSPTRGDGKDGRHLAMIEGLAARGHLGYHNEEQMVVWALKILSTSFMWAASHSRSLGEGTPGTVIGMRDRLVRQLGSYLADAKGSQSLNDAAFAHLLDLFTVCRGEGVSAPLRTSCDEQMQYRSAGYLQARIDSAEVDDGDALERQALNELVAAFTRTVYIGVLDVKHASCLLPHYRRFGALFDRCVEVLVQSIRDRIFLDGRAIEGADALAKALQESLDLHVGGVVDDDLPFLALARLLQQALIVRGPHLAIVRRLGSGPSVRLHTSCIRWAGSKVSALEGSGQDGAAERVASMFKGLVHLTVCLEGRSALDVKTALDQEEDGALASRAWEPLKTYTKRLLSTMAKDPGIKQAAKKANAAATAAAAAAATSGDDDGMDIDADADGSGDEEEPVGVVREAGRSGKRARDELREGSAESELSVTEVKRRRRNKQRAG